MNIPTRCGQLKLNIVRVAEGQHVEAQIRPQVVDLAMGDALLVKKAKRRLEPGPTLDGEAEVIETDAVFVKAIARNSLGRVWRQWCDPFARKPYHRVRGEERRGLSNPR